VKINIETVQEIIVVKLEGDLDGLAAPVAQQRLLPLVKAGCKMAVVMNDVTYMSSAGIRMLLSVYRHGSTAGAHIVLVGIQDQIRAVLQTVGLLPFFTICATSDDAVKHLLST
jgi:anti-sigma B factor antagonist